MDKGNRISTRPFRSTAGLLLSAVGRSESEPQNPAAMEASGPVRTVPVRIVHSEGGAHRRGQLPQSAESGSPSSPPAELAYPFSTCNRQEPEPEPGQEPHGARTLEEDAKRDELARDIMGRDKSLVDILDQSGRRTTMDLMEGLFAPDPVLEAVQLRRRPSAGSRPPGTSRSKPPAVPKISHFNRLESRDPKNVTVLLTKTRGDLITDQGQVQSSTSLLQHTWIRSNTRHQPSAEPDERCWSRDAATSSRTVEEWAGGIQL